MNAVTIQLVELHRSMGEPAEDNRVEQLLQSVRQSMSEQEFAALAENSESIRAAAVSAARERFEATGRELYDPPVEREK